MAHVEKYQAHALGRMCEHYARVAETERGYRRDNIDPERTPLNYNLAPEREGGQAAYVGARIGALGLARAPRANAVRMCDCVVTLPRDLEPARGREFFESVYSFLEGRYGGDGGENVVSAWVHMDESQPHMHFAWVPATPDGRLSAKDVVGRADLRTLHRDMQRAVERDMGCRVGVVLGDGERGRRELSRLGHADYAAATEEMDRARERAREAREEAEAAEAAAGRARAAQREAEAAREASEASAQEARARLECLQREVEEAERRDRALGERLGRERGRNSEVAARHREVAEAGVGAKGEADRLAGEVERAERGVRALEEERDGLAGHVRGLGARLRELEERFAGIAAGLRRGATVRARLGRLGRSALARMGVRVVDPGEAERTRERGRAR